MGDYMLPVDQTISPGLLAVEDSSQKLRTTKQITTRFCQATRIIAALHPLLPKAHGGGLVMLVPLMMARHMWGDGLATSPRLPRTRCSGSITKWRSRYILGPSRTGSPNDGLQLWRCLAPCYSPCSCVGEVPHAMDQFNFPWQVTTRAMCMACSASTRRRCQLQAC